MNNANIQLVKNLCTELLELIDDMEEAEKDNIRSFQDEDLVHTYHYPSPKHRGAVRRRSMDLTRALADMRRPG